MKNSIILVLALLVFTAIANGQSRCIVVKFNGDTLRCDNVSAGGKTIVCKTKGADKIKLQATEVKYYMEPFRMYETSNGETKKLDTLRKKFVPGDGKIHTVLMENDSVYLSEITKTIDGMEFQDYYIHRKQNNGEIMEIREDKTAINVLAKYFGGSCPEFDKAIADARPKFQKKLFPIVEWRTLIYIYTTKCGRG